jgi:hypothetical protein
MIWQGRSLVIDVFTSTCAHYPAEATPPPRARPSAPGAATPTRSHPPPRRLPPYLATVVPPPRSRSLLPRVDKSRRQITIPRRLFQFQCTANCKCPQIISEIEVIHRRLDITLQ